MELLADDPDKRIEKTKTKKNTEAKPPSSSEKPISHDANEEKAKGKKTTTSVSKWTAAAKKHAKILQIELIGPMAGPKEFDFELVRKAYVVLKPKSHPDKVAEISEEIKETANEQTKELNAAKDYFAELNKKNTSNK